MSNLQDYWWRTDGYYDNERGRKCFSVVKFLEKEGILEEPMNYQRFTTIMYQLRKILFI